MTDIVEIPALVLPSPFPTTADRSAGTYNSKSKAWADSEPAFGQSVVDVAQAARTNALAAKEIADDAKLVTGQNKVAAQQAQSAAEKAAAAAADSAAFYGRWSDLAGPLNMPATVSHNGKDWRLQHNLADVALAQPGVSPAWAERSDYIEVGSIRVATKKPTSGVWLDCNAIYLQSSYMELFEQLGLQVYQTGPMLLTRTMPASMKWASVAYGNGVFVAISGNESNSTSVATSTDGITWTVRSALPNAPWAAVTFGNGLFVAVAGGAGGTATTVAATSPDGVTWTQRTMPSGQWGSVAYGNGMFVALSRVNSGSTVAATSPDGITWTQRVLPATVVWTSVAYGNGLFVAVADNTTTGIAATSPDGITWTQRTIPAARWASVTYGNGLFVAVASAGSMAASSPDGINWTARTMPSAVMVAVTFGDGLFVAVSSGTSTSAAVSFDGITWIARATETGFPCTSIAFGDGTFVAVGTAASGNAGTTSASATTLQIKDSYYGYSHLSQFFVPNALTLGSDKYKQFIKAIQ